METGHRRMLLSWRFTLQFREFCLRMNSIEVSFKGQIFISNEFDMFCRDIWRTKRGESDPSATNKPLTFNIRIARKCINSTLFKTEKVNQKHLSIKMAKYEMNRE